MKKLGFYKCFSKKVIDFECGSVFYGVLGFITVILNPSLDYTDYCDPTIGTFGKLFPHFGPSFC